MVVVAFRAPEVPVMVRVAGPVVAELFAVSESVLVLAVVGFGVNCAVTPLGRPADTARVTLPLNPP
jgi:hypothetical protein